MKEKTSREKKTPKNPQKKPKTKYNRLYKYCIYSKSLKLYVYSRHQTRVITYIIMYWSAVMLVKFKFKFP